MSNQLIRRLSKLAQEPALLLYHADQMAVHLTAQKPNAAIAFAQSVTQRKIPAPAQNARLQSLVGLWDVLPIVRKPLVAAVFAPNATRKRPVRLKLADLIIVLCRQATALKEKGWAILLVRRLVLIAQEAQQNINALVPLILIAQPVAAKGAGYDAL